MIESVQVLGQPAMRLSCADGAQATVLMQGAQVVSWIPAGDVERLYLSPLASAGQGQAVRGGIPVIFPQFERRGPLPRHGFARLYTWQWVEGHDRGSHAMGLWRLTDDERTRALWPHGFEAELCVSVESGCLEVELAVANTGATAFDFTAALHTYLRCDDLTRTRLHGLHGAPFEDSLDGRTGRQEIDPMGFQGEIDRIYGPVRDVLHLASGLGRLSIHAQDMPDRVVWNPGPDKAAALPDLPPDDWRRMLCVESGCVRQPVHLSPGDEWIGRQRIDA
ncbi:MAG: D-hexose-6-phosphate mutarotase [Aquabacterium sp.]|jgi:glucose-6-phosphate 1-epimerase|nr:D-hexose-6-phosphate mutarotase [Aquabacterium sp.]